MGTRLLDLVVSLHLELPPDCDHFSLSLCSNFDHMGFKGCLSRIFERRLCVGICTLTRAGLVSNWLFSSAYVQGIMNFKASWCCEFRVHYIFLVSFEWRRNGVSPRSGNFPDLLQTKIIQSGFKTSPLLLKCSRNTILQRTRRRINNFFPTKITPNFLFIKILTYLPPWKALPFLTSRVDGRL